jgi:hypothetical protein
MKYAECGDLKQFIKSNKDNNTSIDEKLVHIINIDLEMVWTAMLSFKLYSQEENNT